MNYEDHSEGEYIVRTYDDGDKYWFLNGEYHREDGPAVEYVSGSKCWYLNGKRHREDGPACEYIDGEKYWYINGKLHREDGPACEDADGTKEWYLNGNIVYCDEENNLKKYSDLSEPFKRSVIKYELRRN